MNTITSSLGCNKNTAKRTYLAIESTCIIICIIERDHIIRLAWGCIKNYCLWIITLSPRFATVALQEPLYFSDFAIYTRTLSWSNNFSKLSISKAILQLNLEANLVVSKNTRLQTIRYWQS